MFIIKKIFLDIRYTFLSNTNTDKYNQYYLQQIYESKDYKFFTLDCCSKAMVEGFFN